MSKTQDENRAAWKLKIEHLFTLQCENVDPDTLAEVERAIQRSPYDSVSDAVMQINGGWICGLRYDLCLAYLLRAGCLEPSGFGVFRINRKKLPQIEVENPLVDGMERASSPVDRPKPVSVVEAEIVDQQWGLFA